jgi:hypothetical protein
MESGDRAFLTSALDEGERLASLSGRFTLEERTPVPIGFLCYIYQQQRQ